MKKTLLKTIYKLGGFAPFHLLNRDKVLILMYHRFSRERSASKTSSAEFAAHLEYLSKNNCVLSLSEALKCLNNEKPLPPNAAVITIDDGYKDAYEIAFPLLKQYKMPATLFAVTDFLDGKCWLWTDLMRYVLRETTRGFISVEFETGERIELKLTNEIQKLKAASEINSRLKKTDNKQKNEEIKCIAEILEVEIPALPTDEYAPVSWEQAREMDAHDLSVESHTATHPILTNVSQTELDYELRTSKQRLETVLKRNVEIFCYPNGSLNDAIWQAVKNCGYQCAVTTDYGFNKRGANPFLLKRVDAPVEIENFAQTVSGFEALKQNVRN